jgi:hypothetical protein
VQEHFKARSEGIISEQIGAELVVYDHDSQVAHCLSEASALVWKHCDGRSSCDDLARQLGLDPDVVARSLVELGTCGLLLEPDAPAEAGYSRREATARLAKWGGLAFSAPLIYSVAIGPASAAASGGANGSPCFTGADCGSGNCVSGACCNTPCPGECNTCGGGTCFALAAGTPCTGGMCNGSGVCIP